MIENFLLCLTKFWLPDIQLKAQSSGDQKKKIWPEIQIFGTFKKIPQVDKR